MGRKPRPRHREPARLPGWQRWAVYATTALLLVSGSVWLLLHYGLQQETPYGMRPHPHAYQWLRLHGAAAMLSLLAIGALLPVHVRRGWTLRTNRTTGAVLVAWIVLLVVSGYALYYFASESTRGWIGPLHWIAGLALVPALAWHVRVGLAQRRRRITAASAAPLRLHRVVEIPKGASGG